MSTVHVVPTHGPSHTTDGADCWCVNGTEPVAREDGSIGWIVTHSNFAPVPASAATVENGPSSHALAPAGKGRSLAGESS